MWGGISSPRELAGVSPGDLGDSAEIALGLLHTRQQYGFKYWFVCFGVGLRLGLGAICQRSCSDLKFNHSFLSSFTIKGGCYLKPPLPLHKKWHGTPKSRYHTYVFRARPGIFLTCLQTEPKEAFLEIFGMPSTSPENLEFVGAQK